MICSNSVVVVGNGLEEEENGKLGGEHVGGRCELVVVESGKLVLGGGRCELGVEESGRLV